MEIRTQRADDLEAIRQINAQAFQREQSSAGVFDQLRATRTDILSLVAEANARVIGHVLFSPASVVGRLGEIAGMGLGQLAILPEFQRQGIGSALTWRGLALLREAACPFSLVVGHASYYPRFGYVRGSTLGLRCQWPGVPDESFMVLVLDTARMAGARGVARFEGID